MLDLAAICNALTITDASVKVIKSSSWIVRTFNRYFGRTYRIAVLGYTGGGKSSLLASILGKEFNGEITRKKEIVKLQLPNGRMVEFHDCPGQANYNFLLHEVKKLVVTKKIDGIINVVCYGYNENSANTIPPIDNNTGEVKDSFLEENRKSELKQLDEWVNDITSITKVRWIITLINKADLWLNHKKEVGEYYSHGEYATRFNGLERLNCIHHYIPYCSRISKFGGQPTTIHLDDDDKIKLRTSLINTIYECLKAI